MSLAHNTPHDTYVGNIFSCLDIAKDYFKNSLPADIVAVCDWDTLKPTEKTFIDDSLKQKIADILFRITIGGQQGYIYLLIEHASKPDQNLVFRAFQYSISAMDYHVKHMKKARGLPVVVPCILYTGKHPFNRSLNLMDYFEDKALAERFLFTFKPVHLMDIGHASDAVLQAQYYHFRLGALLLKHVRDRDTIGYYALHQTVSRRDRRINAANLKRTDAHYNFDACLKPYDERR